MEKQKFVKKENTASEKSIFIDKNERYYIKRMIFIDKTNTEIVANRFSDGYFKSIVIYWFRKSIPGHGIAGFFYRTRRDKAWQIVPYASWMSEYKTVEDFLIDHPQLLKFFGSKDGVSKEK